jgi:hypothetical protein
MNFSLCPLQQPPTYQYAKVWIRHPDNCVYYHVDLAAIKSAVVVILSRSNRQFTSVVQWEHGITSIHMSLVEDVSFSYIIGDGHVAITIIDHGHQANQSTLTGIALCSSSPQILGISTGQNRIGPAPIGKGRDEANLAWLMNS